MNSMSYNLRNRNLLGEDFLPGSVAEVPWTPEPDPPAPMAASDAFGQLLALAQTPVLGLPLWMLAGGAFLLLRNRR